MKIIVNTIGVYLLIMILGSCDKGIGDFLDKAPGVDITEDVVFSSQQELLSFVSGIYFDGIPAGYPYKGFNDISGNVLNTGGATEEADLDRSWYPSNDWNGGSIGPGSIIWHEDAIYNKRWEVIRRINTVLERINDVPDLTEEEKNQFIGEVLFIRALTNFEILKRYGGFPIVKERFDLTDDLMIPRSTVEECVNFIVEDCDRAAEFLPDANMGIMRGRATKGAALMVKSRTLLYAASPLLNTGDPYLDFGENNELICYGSTDVQRWQLAADAARAVIDWAPQGQCHLIEDQGEDKNYKYVWEQTDNSEIILADKPISEQNAWSMMPWGNYVPATIYNGQVGASVPMNHVMKYEKRDGTPQSWNMEDGGDDLNQKYEELDYRFKQSVAYNGAYWNEDYPVVETYEGGAHISQCLGGAWLRKGIPTALTRSNPVIVNWIVFRLAEAYLNYAEALNEANGGPTPEAYEAVNKIRNRSGMPDLPEGLIQEEFRQRVRNERAVELFFEDHRFWDIRRWLIAEEEGVMQGDFYGLKINPVGSGEVTEDTEFRYDFYVFETRTFHKKMYLHPYPLEEVNKGYIVENPGYIR
ncbi:RagB/SusD family nutrient uptake outer membrane protein [Membranihabitans maritimus]|uniref:RagB/SusD family nutrient uptake outer membrane protein n=1 Tax=Membranihabitans maritimus TaxID=2904244 RepID=UPI001F4438CF|nr:RagB/SusD family nutrient uptake outer membrane protein [Membranihabitans maritimus]